MSYKTQVDFDTLITDEVKRDFARRFCQSYQNLQNEKEHAIFRKFWSSFIPSFEEGAKRGQSPEIINEAIKKLKSDRQLNKGSWTSLIKLYEIPLINALYFFFTDSYWPGLDNCPQNKSFPVECLYDLIVPYKQKDNFIICSVVPAGMESGDQAVLLIYTLPHVYRMGETTKKVFAPIINAKDRSLNLKDIAAWYGAAKINRDNYRKEVPTECIGGTFSFQYKSMLRLPCYNVPLQCAYEMISDVVGDFWGGYERMVELRSEAIRDKSNQKKLTRLDLDKTKFHAMLDWNMWRVLCLTDEEQLESLQLAMGATDNAPAGLNGVRQHRKLRKQCESAFRKQLTESRVRKLW
jgi:hypothetical protein